MQVSADRRHRDERHVGRRIRRRGVRHEPARAVRRHDAAEHAAQPRPPRHRQPSRCRSELERVDGRRRRHRLRRVPRRRLLAHGRRGDELHRHHRAGESHLPYSVRARDAAGNVSALSDAVAVTTPAGQRRCSPTASRPATSVLDDDVGPGRAGRRNVMQAASPRRAARRRAVDLGEEDAAPRRTATPTRESAFECRARRSQATLLRLRRHLEWQWRLSVPDGRRASSRSAATRSPTRRSAASRPAPVGTRWSCT